MMATMDFRRLVFVVVFFISLVLCASAGFYEYLKVSGNFHIVEQGHVYRAAQLNSAELEQALSSHGIRSVLNLRGAFPGEAWYDNEIAVSRTKGIAHYDYGLSAERLVSVAQAEEILLAIRNAPKPILIHCKAGSDRTGLVSALYLFSRGVDAKKAERELSLRYGHFPYLVGGTGAMDDSFHAYVGDSLFRKTGRTFGAFPAREPQGTTNMKVEHR